jgi:hypothetical protein
MTYGNLLWAASRIEATVSSMVAEGAIEMLLMEVTTIVSEWLAQSESEDAQTAEPTFRENHLTCLLGILSSKSAKERELWEAGGLKR